jgi:RHS repeat-associated protein
VEVSSQVKKICAGVDGSYKRYGSSYTVTFNLPEGVNERTYAVKLKVRDDEYQYGYETVYVTVKRPKHFYFYVKDHLGSTRAVVDDAGDVVEAYDYYPFGLQSRSYKEKGDPLTKETFTGKEQDTESNLHYYGARFYDPSLGRFLSVDPLSHKAPSFNPFHYTKNNPINRIDPDGREDTETKELTKEEILERIRQAQESGDDILQSILDEIAKTGNASASGSTILEALKEAGIVLGEEETELIENIDSIEMSENELRVLVHKEFDIPLDSDLAESIRIDKNGIKTTIVTTDSSITIEDIKGVEIIIFENFVKDLKADIKAVTFIKTADNKVVRIVEPRGIIPTQIDTLK